MKKEKIDIKKANNKIAILAMAATLIVAVIVVGLLARKNTDDFEKTVVASALGNLQTIARTESQHTERRIIDIYGNLKVLAENPKIKKALINGWTDKDGPSTDDYRPEQLVFEHLTEDISSLYRLDNKGIVQSRFPYKKGKAGSDYSLKPGVRMVLENNRPYISDLFKTNSGVYCISICYPVFEQEQFIGILRAIISMDVIHACLKDSKIGQVGYAWLLDDNEIIMSHPDTRYVGKHISITTKEANPDLDWSELRRITKRMAEGEKGTGLFCSISLKDKNIKKVKKLTAFIPIRIAGKLWSLGAIMRYDEISGPVKVHARNVNIGVTLLMLVFSGVGVWFYRTQKERTKLTAKIESAEKLETANLQLLAQEQQLKASNQQLGFEAASRKQTQKRLDLALEASNTGLWDWEIKTSETYFSPTYYTMLGYEPGEFSATYDSWLNLLHPDGIEAIEEGLKNHLVDGEPYSQEFRMKGKDGSWYWIHARGSVVERDDNNEPIRMTGTHTNITKRKQAEESLRRANDIVVQSPIVAFLWKNTEGWPVEYASENVSCMFGWTSEDFISGRVQYTNVIHPDDLPRVGQEVEKFSADVNAKMFTHAPYRITTRDGQVKWIEDITTIQRAEDGSVISYEGILLDITERKQIESRQAEYMVELKQAKETAISMMEDAENAREEVEKVNQYLELATARANDLTAQAELTTQTKSQFLANMSHEIRTPMNAIIGFSDILADEDLTDDQKEDVNIIRESGHNLLVLIDDILDFSKIEAGQLKTEIMDCSLANLLNSVSSLMKSKATENKLEFKIIKSKGLPAHIYSDPSRLQQCLINLIGNAVKFTKQGHIYVNVSLEDKDNHPFIRFDVEDTGIGIASNKQDAIFDLFTQADGSTSREFGGTGLGLAITRQLAELLGGELTLTSEVDKGSVFSLVIPANVDITKQPTFDEQDTSAGTDLDHVKTELPEFSGNVLVAEDAPTNQVLITALLKRLGLQVTIAEDGNQALQKVMTGKFDLIFMDIMMPHMNGYEATRAIRKEGITTPIVALTANAMAGDDIKCLEAGCDEYLSKPIDRRELLKALDKYLPSKEKALTETIDSVKAQVDEIVDLCVDQAPPKPSDKQAAATEVQEEIINLSQLVDILGDEEAVKEIVPVYLSDNRGHFDKLEEAINSGDANAVRLNAHAIKGAGRNFGAKQLSEIAYRIESAGTENDVETAASFLDELKEEYAKVEAFFSRDDWLEVAKQQVAGEIEK